MIWTIALTVMAGVVIRPFGVPEAIWAVAGALAIVAVGLLHPSAAWMAVMRGDDVYLFLMGMMLLAEVARQEGLFERLAEFAAAHGQGSASRLFLLTYLVGTLVTIFLSNDTTAVVLTPAIYAVCRALGARPLPFLYLCAFVANAASFVLPISNPANLVVFGSHLPPLGSWIATFLLPSILAIVATYGVLRWRFRSELAGNIKTVVPHQPFGTGARVAALGICLAAIFLVIASALGWPLGWPTALAGGATGLLTSLFERRSPVPLLRSVSWSVLPLVAGLFVLVAAVEQTSLLTDLATGLRAAAAVSVPATSFWTGLLIAVACNLMNNLPAGLFAGAILGAADAPHAIAASALIGVDLGPNLSVTGSLATILWLLMLRREGIVISAAQFLAMGVMVTAPALLLALGAVSILAR